MFDPLEIRGVVFPNRVAVSPMAQYSAIAGVVQPWHLQHLGSLAVSGAGLVCMESTSVARPGWGSKTCVALHSDEQEKGLMDLFEHIRTFCATPMGMQLNHSGRKASAADPSEGRRALRPEEGAWTIYGPSAEPYSPDWPSPTPLSRTQIHAVVESFAAAAKRAASMPLQVLEVHAAHGYLLHSFLSPVANLRTDEYGGDLSNRMRLPMEVIQAVRAVWPKDRVLGIRLNARDWIAGGLDVDDVVEIAKAFKASGGDYVTVSAGALRGDVRIPAATGYLVPYARHLRDAAGVYTFVTGLITSPLQADAIIRSRQADMVCLGRAFLDDPRWVWRAARALGREIAYPMQYQMAHPTIWPRS